MTHPVVCVDGTKVQLVTKMYEKFFLIFTAF